MIGKAFLETVGCLLGDNRASHEVEHNESPELSSGGNFFNESKDVVCSPRVKGRGCDGDQNGVGRDKSAP